VDELSNQNEIKQILNNYKTIAIVGLSRNQKKDSFIVASYLKNHGFKIIPVNPFAKEILKEKCYSNLMEIPFELQKTIDVIDIFRPSDQVLSIVKEAIQLKEIHNLPYVIWMQLNIINNNAAKLAIKAGFSVIMDKCMKLEHLKLFSNKD
jgi:predicted CoA-binding protein